VLALASGFDCLWLAPCSGYVLRGPLRTFYGLLPGTRYGKRGKPLPIGVKEARIKDDGAWKNTSNGGKWI